MRNFLLILFLVGLTVASILGCERPMAKPMMDAVTPTEMPTKDDPEALAMTLVQGAINLYKTEGRETMIAYYNSPASIDGQWYVFIADENNIYLAHPVKPEFMGRDITQIPGIDGTLIGAEIAMATEEGRWTNYLWPNPDTSKLEQKRTWSIRYDGYLFAAGYYEPWGPDPATFSLGSKSDPEAFTLNFVLAAIARYEFYGADATAAYYNAPANIDGQWYVAISDTNDIYVAHPTRPDLIGKDRKETLGRNGEPVGAEIVKATGTGHWVEYLWPNPASGEVEQKRTWAIRHDGYVFGSGYYEPVTEEAPTAAEDTAP